MTLYELSRKSIDRSTHLSARAAGITPLGLGFIRHGRGYRAESGNDAGGNEGARSRLWHGVSRAVSRPDARYLRFEVERGHSACMRACKEVVRGPWQLEIRTGWETPANG
jgi:hypothetical protein